MYNTYSNHGNKIVKPTILFTTFPYFFSVKHKTANGFPERIEVAERQSFKEPFKTFNSQTVNILFHIIQN